MSRFIGKENISSKSLHDLATNRFASSALYHKHMNIFDDLGSSEIRNVSYFKIATCGSPVPAEHKFGDQFNFDNYAKMTFSANRIPGITDSEDDAFYGRWIVIPHENVFTGCADKKLIDKIATGVELSGLLNQAIEKLRMLLEKENFSYSKTDEEVKAIMQRESSSVAMFVQDCCQEKVRVWKSLENMHIAYERFCKDNKLGKLPIRKFGIEFRKYCNYAIRGRSSTGKVNGWRNVEVIP